MRLRSLEEGVDVAHLRPGDTLQIADALERLDHLRRRAATAVPEAVEEHALACADVILEVPGACAELRDGRLRAEGVGGREVRTYLRAVDALPDERVMRQLSELVVGELLGQKAVHAGSAEDLWQLAVEAERVGKPSLGAAAAELLLEEPLADDELANVRLAGGQVAVGLDPGAADRQPPASLCVPLDAREQRRVQLLGPCMVERAGAREPVLRVAVEQRALGGERAQALAARLGYRPPPGGVEVRVADRGDLVRDRGVAMPIERVQHRLRVRPGRAVVGAPDVADAVELCQEIPGPGRVGGLLVGLDLLERGEVEPELPGCRVEAGELAAPQPDLREVAPADDARAGCLEE